MSKKKTISELTNLLAIALRHKIGSIVNKEEIYANKYSRDADILINEARKIAISENWNLYDKEKIRTELQIKLKKELEEKDFIDNKKFELMDEQIDKLLLELNLA